MGKESKKRNRLKRDKQIVKVENWLSSHTNNNYINKNDYFDVELYSMRYVSVTKFT